MKQLNVTELDFDAIKDNLKDYFKNNPNGEYSDWDFEGSGLNHLLDVLAYNTHYNAVVAHNAMNESFIDSAQVRSNVVSRAKLLGYTPRSQTAAMASISLSFAGAVNKNNSTYTLFKGQTLSTSIDGETFVYVTLDDYTALLDEVTQTYTFDNVVIYQGRVKEKTFVVESGSIDQKYVIEDTTIDLDHLTVNVFDNAYTTAVETYSLFTSLSGVEPSTPAYFINENYDGNYEIQFGDNIFGKRPPSLSVIKIKYLSTRGLASNGANVFTWTSPGTVTPKITTLSGSTNGSGKEDIQSIRQNAPLSFITQNRAVTSSDYKNLVGQILNNIETVSVWGGEDNTPPQYGKVYISVKPYDSEVLTDLDKKFLISELEPKRVIGIQPELVDPDFTYLFFDILFKFDSNRTNISSGQLSTKVENLLVEFNRNNLQRFDGVFRYSHLLSEIDQLDVAIVNSFVRVFVYKKAVVEYGKLISTPVDFQMEIYGDVDQLDPVLSSDSWVYNGVSLQLEDQPIPNSQYERRLYAYSIGSDGIKRKLFKDVGVINLNTGLVSLESLPVNRTETINIYLTPASNDVVSKRNKLLTMDIGKTTITPDVDTIAVSGSSGVNDYKPFLRHRDNNNS